MTETEADSGLGSSPAQPLAAPRETSFSFSRGFTAWLTANRCSLAFTSYLTGQLFFVGLTPERKVSVQQANFTRAMGLAVAGGRLLLASDIAIWRLENILKPGQTVNQTFDRMYMPRATSFTGDLDVHELGVLADGRVVFANTKFSCLATLSPIHSFEPIWTPPFISKLVPEDRCHLNGLALADGEPRLVSMVSRSDAVAGWRDRRWEGGLIMDVRDNRVVADDLSMPHSPRLRQGDLWFLESGRGYLVRVDPVTGTKRDVAFCPGFLRGLAFAGRYALVTTSLPRDGSFRDLPLQDNLAARDVEAKCAVYIIDLQTGGIAEWIELRGEATELFDIAVLPGALCPSSVAVGSPNMASLITVDD